jgi:hypothetical protein
MRNAYALLGVLFLIVFAGAYIAVEKANAPSDNMDVDPTSSYYESDTIEPSMLTLTSPVFEEDGVIPEKFTCDGDNINPELRISGVPEDAETLVLVMDDPDIPESAKESMGIEKFDHWVLYNIPANVEKIPEGASLGTPGVNSSGTEGYRGPCPPDREHRYVFRLYAISGQLNFIKTPTLDEVEKAAQGNVIQSATLIGRYDRSQ